MKKKHQSKRPYLIGFALIIAVIGVTVFVILALLGPAIGNVFSNIVGQFDGASNGYVYSPNSQSNGTSNLVTVPVLMTATPLPLPTASPPAAIQNSSIEMTATTLANIFASTPEGTQGSVGGQAQGTPIAAQGGGLPDTGGGVASPPTPLPPTAEPISPPDMFFEDYGVNPFIDTEDDHLSTFAMDVDTASYTLARNYLLNVGQLPPPDAIRPEEFINYFPMNYASPENNDAFAIHLDAMPAPFGYDDHYLLRVGIQGSYILNDQRDPALLIFVIDVSGSMDGETRLGMVKESLRILVNELSEQDRVGIVIYSNEARVVLNPTSANDTNRILDAIDSLHTEGSTYAEAGLQLGYQLASDNMRDDEITRVILLSDGVANVGQTGPDAILQSVDDAVEQGITLSTIGFGMGNFNDVLMEQLANDGDGNYYYVDNLREARRVFQHNLTSTLQVIAYDAKIQVDFNPTVTDRYRLIGYENRAIADDDFRNDTVDAGEVGAGHSITALYELALEDTDSDGVIATVHIRYQDAETEGIVEVTQIITTDDLSTDAPLELQVLAGVAEFSELLRESYWAQEGSYGDLLAYVNHWRGMSPEVDEFIAIVQRANSLSDG